MRPWSVLVAMMVLMATLALETSTVRATAQPRVDEESANAAQGPSSSSAALQPPLPPGVASQSPSTAAAPAPPAVELPPRPSGAVGDLSPAPSVAAPLDLADPRPHVELPAPSRGAEVTERRTERSRTFATDQPGVFITRVSESPLHYRDGGGRWQEIDTELVDAADGRLRNRSGPFTLGIAPEANARSLARLDLDDARSVGFSLAGAAGVRASASAEVATYARALPETDLRLTSHRRGLKEEIVLASPTAPDRFLFPLGSSE